MIKGMYAEALSNFQRYAALCPNDANPHDSMGDLLWQMGNLAEAIKEYNQALRIKPDFHVSAGKIAYIHAMEEDYTQAVTWINRAIAIAPSSGTKAVWHWVNAWIHNWCGNLTQADASMELAHQLAVTQDNEYTIAGVNWLKAFMERDAGRYDSAEAFYRNALRIFLKISNDIHGDSAAYFLFTASVRLAEGSTGQTRWCLDNVKRLMPEIGTGGIDFLRYWYDCTQAELLCAQKDYRAAADQGSRVGLPAIPAFEYPQVLIYNIPFRRDFVARAYAGLGMKAEAIREYDRLITFDPAGSDRRLVHPLYHYQLAKLYEEAGQPEKAVAQYRAFLDIWNDSDPFFPEPADAKKRMENLSK
jgi:tetratricopeptide (TPR) repeat protein